MNFVETGLPNAKVIEDAFNYSKKDVMSSAAENVKEVQAQIKAHFARALKGFDQALEAGKISEEEHRLNKEALDKKLPLELAKANAYVIRELNGLFASRRVFAAKEALNQTTSPSNDLIAATLLLEAMRSPIDYKTIAAEISPAVADIVAHVMHLETYPAERSAHMKTVSDDTKRAYLIGLTSSMNHIMQQAKAMKASGGMIQLQAGQEQQIFEDVKAAWGTDTKLESRFLKIFNDTMALVGSGFTMAANEAGELELLKGGRNQNGARPKGPRPPNNGGGNGGIGTW